MILIMIVCYALSPDDLSHGVYVPISYFLVHRFMVALKYATMSDEEYARILPTRPLRPGEMEVLLGYNNQAQIITGLVGQNRELMEFQLAAAAAELGIDIPRAYIHVPRTPKSAEDGSSLLMWEMFLKDGIRQLYDSKTEAEANFEKNDGIFELKPEFLDIGAELSKLNSSSSKSNSAFIKIPIGLLALALLGRSAKTYMKVAMTVNQVLTSLLFFSVIQPFLLLRFQPVSTNGFTIAYFVLSTIMNVALGWVMVMFLTGTVYDALRKRSLAIKLNDLIAPSATRFTHNLKVLRWLYDKANGDVDFIFRDNFQDKKNTLDIEALLSNLEAEERGSEEDVRHPEDSRGALGEADAVKTELKPPMPAMLVNSNNVLAFVALRQMMQIFGKRFTVRIDVLVAFLAQMMLVLMLVFVIILANSADPVAVMNTSIFRQAVIGVAEFSLVVIFVVLVGGVANNSYNSHRESMSAQQFRVNSRHVLLKNTVKRLEDLKEVYEKLLLKVMHEMCSKQHDEMVALEAAYEAANESRDAESSTTPPPREADSDDDDEDVEYTKRTNAETAAKLRRDIPLLEARIARMQGLAEEDENLLEVLGYAADSIELGNEFHPIKFLGITCTIEVAYSLFTTVLSFYCYMAAALSGNAELDAGEM